MQMQISNFIIIQIQKRLELSIIFCRISCTKNPEKAHLVFVKNKSRTSFFFFFYNHKVTEPDDVSQEQSNFSLFANNNLNVLALFLPDQCSNPAKYPIRSRKKRLKML